MTKTIENFEIAGHLLTLQTSPEQAFEPNITTQRIGNAASIKPGSTVLDLGCGVGPIAIAAAKNGAAKVYAIDVVPAAAALARENCKINGVEDKVTVLCGDLFEPVKGLKFDTIINDVSGIANEAARISPWYPPDVPAGGDDGTEVVTRMFDQSMEYLTETGELFFATSSLSNAAKIVDHAKQCYANAVEHLASYKIPFCPELKAAVNQLSKLQEEGKVTFEQKRSRLLWTLDIYLANLTKRSPVSA